MAIQQMLSEFNNRLLKEELVDKIKSSINLREEGEININLVQIKNFGYKLRDYIEKEFPQNFPEFKIEYNIIEKDIYIRIAPKIKLKRREVENGFYKIIKFFEKAAKEIKEK